MVMTKDLRTHMVEPKNKLSTLGLEWPELDPHYYLPQSSVDTVERWIKMADDGRFVNALLMGHAGTGKTSLVRQVAAYTGRPYAFIPLGGVSEPRQFFGRTAFVQGVGTKFIPGLLMLAMEVPNCLIHLDEINRVNDGSCTDPLHHMLDDSRAAFKYDDADQIIHIASNVMFFATMNKGGEYTGTIDMDQALYDRFDYLGMERLPKSAAEKIVREKVGLDLASITRIVGVGYDLEVGLRSVLKAAWHLKYGSSLKEALLAGFSVDLSKIEKALGQETLRKKVPSVDKEVVKWPS